MSSVDLSESSTPHAPPSPTPSDSGRTVPLSPGGGASTSSSSTASLSSNISAASTISSAIPTVVTSATLAAPVTPSHRNSIQLSRRSSMQAGQRINLQQIAGGGGGGATPTTNNPAGSPEDGVEYEYEMFHKTLTSDLSLEQSLSLIRDVHNTDPIFAELFETQDLPACNQILSVLTFSAGDKIITAGEDATFAALLLEGDVTAKIYLHPKEGSKSVSRRATPTLSTTSSSSTSNTTTTTTSSTPTTQQQWIDVPLTKSSWVGEMAYFERGPRSADITANSSATLAVLSYEGLDRLATEGHELGHKFTMLLAMHSILKLRKMADNQKLSSSSTAPEVSAVSSTSGASSSPTPGIKLNRNSARQKETLFLERLKKQEKLLVEQQQNLERETKLVKKKVVEADTRLGNAKNKIQRLENEIKEQRASINELTRKLANEKKKNKEAAESILKAQQERQEALATIPEWERKLAVEKARYKAAENIRLQQEQAWLQKQKAWDEEILTHMNSISTLRTSIQLSSTQTEEQKQLLTLSEKENKSKEREIILIRDKTQALENDKTLVEFKYQQAKEKIESLDQEIVVLNKKISEYKESYERLLTKYRIDIRELQREKQYIYSSYNIYQKLIRVLCLKTYVRNFLFRRQLFNIHLRISEMLCQRWEERVDDYKRVYEKGLRLGGGGGGGGGEDREQQQQGCPFPFNLLLFPCRRAVRDREGEQ